MKTRWNIFNFCSPLIVISWMLDVQLVLLNTKLPDCVRFFYFCFIMHCIPRIESVSRNGIACYHGAELILENKTDDLHKFDMHTHAHSVHCTGVRSHKIGFLNVKLCLQMKTHPAQHWMMQWKLHRKLQQNRLKQCFASFWLFTTKFNSLSMLLFFFFVEKNVNSFDDS